MMMQNMGMMHIFRHTVYIRVVITTCFKRQVTEWSTHIRGAKMALILHEL